MKKGFTLIELLAVIALLGIIFTFVFTDTLDFLNIGKNRALKIQENNIKEAAELYLTDVCLYPISTALTCDSSLTKTFDSDGLSLFNGNLNLSVLEDNEYIEEVYYKGNKCNATITFTDNKVTNVDLEC